jgi:hypothetical protein
LNSLYSSADLLRNNVSLIDLLLAAQGNEVKSNAGLELSDAISQGWLDAAQKPHFKGH